MKAGANRAKLREQRRLQRGGEDAVDEPGLAHAEGTLSANVETVADQGTPFSKSGGEPMSSHEVRRMP